VLREADLLRAAILREQATNGDARQDGVNELSPTDASSPTSEDHAGAQRLMFALRQEGLLVKTEGVNAQLASPKVKRPFWMMPMALAASVLVGFFALQALQLGQLNVLYEEPPTMRGQVQQISMRDKAPKAKAQHIAQKLQAAGLKTRIYQDREQFVVDIDVIAETLEPASSALTLLGIEARVGQVRITVQKLAVQKPD
jgi:hypothetical protein